MLRNSQALAQGLLSRGFSLVSGGTGEYMVGGGWLTDPQASAAGLWGAMGAKACGRQLWSALAQLSAFLDRR